MVRGVVQLLARTAPANRTSTVAESSGRHGEPAGEVRPRRRVERGVGERLEGEPHVLRRHRLAVLPTRTRTQVESPRERVHPLPARGQGRPIGRGVDRRAAGREIGQPLVHLVSDVPRHGFGRERRQQVGRIAGRGDDHGAAPGTIGAIAAAGRRRVARAAPATSRDPSSAGSAHARLERVGRTADQHKETVPVGACRQDASYALHGRIMHVTAPDFARIDAELVYVIVSHNRSAIAVAPGMPVALSGGRRPPSLFSESIHAPPSRLAAAAFARPPRWPPAAIPAARPPAAQVNFNVATRPAVGAAVAGSHGHRRARPRRSPTAATR